MLAAWEGSSSPGPGEYWAGDKKTSCLTASSKSQSYSGAKGRNLSCFHTEKPGAGPGIPLSTLSALCLPDEPCVQRTERNDSVVTRLRLMSCWAPAKWVGRKLLFLTDYFGRKMFCKWLILFHYREYKFVSWQEVKTQREQIHPAPPNSPLVIWRVGGIP